MEFIFVAPDELQMPEVPQPQTLKTYGDGVRQFLAWCAEHDVRFINTSVEEWDPYGGAEPDPQRMREALFSAVESWCGSLSGLRFLDLYAGSGAVGLEAWSRGAGVVTLVEQDRRRHVSP